MFFLDKVGDGAILKLGMFGEKGWEREAVYFTRSEMTQKGTVGNSVIPLPPVWVSSNTRTLYGWKSNILLIE